MNRITIPGAPVPWMRAGGGKFRFTPKRQREYQAYVANAYRLSDNPMILSQVTICVWAYVPDLRTRDIDNLAKTVSDALNGVAYKDDKQITSLHAYKILDRENPRVELVVEPDLSGSDFGVAA